MADGVGLENRYWETNRGFESHVLRQFLRQLAAQGEATRRSPRNQRENAENRRICFECGLCHFVIRGAWALNGRDLELGLPVGSISTRQGAIDE